MPSKKTERITLRLTPGTKAELKRQARKDKRSLSAFCHIIFDEGLIHYLPKPESTEQQAPEQPKEQVTA